MVERNRVFPFFVGCPRSGTTLLRAMLDNHSQLAIPGESHFIPRLARTADRFAADEFVADLLADERFQRWELDANVVRAAIANAAPASVADALRVVYSAYAVAHGKPLYGDKTPGYVRELPLLAELFPEARFVHLVRDGRDVVLSLRELEWAQRGGLETLAEFWRTNVEQGLAAREQLGSRYREARYEELVRNPEAVLRELCVFLDLPFERAMLSYHERAGMPAVRRDEHRHLELPPTQGLRDWRTQMSRAELAQLEAIAGDALERVGYARAADGPR
jgi:hypothetical protein